MRHRLFGIAATLAVTTLAVAFVAAQDTTTPNQPDGQTTVQTGTPPPQGQAGQGRGQGRGLGPGQGLGTGQGPGQGLGPGQQRGPRAGRGGPGMGQGRPRAGRGGFLALDLTDDQRTKVTDLQRAMRDQTAPLRDELQFARRTLHRELFADARDDAKVKGLVEKIAALEKQLTDMHLKQATAVSELLTPEQRETMRLRGRQGPGPFAGRGPGRGPGRGGPGAR